MSDSLRDQLLKSGLVKKLKSEARPAPAPVASKPAPSRPAPPPRRQPAPSAEQLHERDLARAYALRARQEKEERERVQREAERSAREKKERRQKLAALLDGKARNSADADIPRHFPHGNKIRRVYCTAEQLANLNRGDLAVVQLAGRYLMVERDVALQAQAVQADALVLLCDPNAPAEDDVPPDVTW